mmetsp:Transcript_62523/g.129889  ORF Transcript_62523/g.129889 Transcript_62523/m.129889 type:complete len:139 (+) Transcript_62523:340-756(+)
MVGFDNLTVNIELSRKFGARSSHNRAGCESSSVGVTPPVLWDLQHHLVMYDGSPELLVSEDVEGSSVRRDSGGCCTLVDSPVSTREFSPEGLGDTTVSRGFCRGVREGPSTGSSSSLSVRTDQRMENARHRRRDRESG